jgi:hypothetical protein
VRGISSSNARAADPDAADLAPNGQAYALIASAAVVVTESAAEKTEIDPKIVSSVGQTQCQESSCCARAGSQLFAGSVSC